MKYEKNSGVLSVTELTNSIKTSLELQYRFIHIQGEISNLRVPYSGHIYFTLKDSAAQIRAVMFKGQSRYLSKTLADGQEIICHGRISVYEPRGEYQIIVDTVDFAGAGNLQIEFERLKRNLAEEGLFNSETKRTLPPFPEHIVIITSPTGAAIHDFLKVARKRDFWGKISVFPVVVQGKKASEQISLAIEKVCSSMNADLIVLLRGGGSLEDLWPFNEERTARAIHKASVPVVTGIGHDTDYTIADMCADVHAHTPTAAAENIIADSEVLREHLQMQIRSLSRSIVKKLTDYEDTIRALRRIIGNLALYLSNYTLKLDYSLNSLVNSARSLVASSSANINNALEKLLRQAPLNKITIQEMQLAHLRVELSDAQLHILSRNEERLGKQAALLDSVSPLAVLARGYSIINKTDTETREKQIITSSVQVEKGDMVNVRLHRGSLECEVVKKKDGEDAQNSLH
jgi:exodeoxyribonuclease VII large subunit